MTENTKKGRQTININVDPDVKEYFQTRYAGVQSRFIGNMLRQYMEQEKDAPETEYIIMHNEFRFAPKSKK